MAKGMTARNMQIAVPQWMAEPISGHLVAGGVKLDAAAFAVDAKTGVKTVKSGTVVGRTFTEAAASAPFGPAADTDDEVFLLAFDVYNAVEDNDATLLKGNVVIFENYLPGKATMTAAVLGKVRAKYICKQGVK